MPYKRRPENRSLPKCWQFTHGAYYYRVPRGQEPLWDGKKRFRLGSNLVDAYCTWSERLQRQSEERTIGDLLGRYALEVIPTKAPKTRADNYSQMKRLRSVFGDMTIDAIRPTHFYQYYDKHSAKTAARRELALLSHALTKAVAWGLIDRHPTKGQVELPNPKARTRHVEDWEIEEVFKLHTVRKKGSILAVQAYIRLKLLTGLRQGDLLRLRESDLREDGIHVKPSKTAATSRKYLIFKWTPKLREAVNAARAVRPVKRADYLFCNRHGEPYVKDEVFTDSWKTMWQRFMTRLLNETEVEERFTEHDLRAKVGTDAESLERARVLLAHVDSRVTWEVYRRKPELIQPLE